MKIITKSCMIASTYQNLTHWLLENCPAIVDQLGNLTIFFF
jgi:hypothetical protein